MAEKTVPHTDSTSATYSESKPILVSKTREQKKSSHTGSNKGDNCRWIFSSEYIKENTTIAKGFADGSDRLFRQQAANIIQDVSKMLSIQPVAINTAIVYMHRFFCVSFI